MGLTANWAGTISVQETVLGGTAINAHDPLLWLLSKSECARVNPLAGFK